MLPRWWFSLFLLLLLVNVSYQAKAKIKVEVKVEPSTTEKDDKVETTVSITPTVPTTSAVSTTASTTSAKQEQTQNRLSQSSSGSSSQNSVVKDTGTTSTSKTPDDDGSSNSQQKTANGAGGTNAPSAATEKKEEPKGVDWIGAGFVAVLVVNIAALVMVRVGVEKLYQATDICHQMMNSIHQLGINSMRVGVGPTTKKIITDYTKSRQKDFKEFNG